MLIILASFLENISAIFLCVVGGFAVWMAILVIHVWRKSKKDAREFDRRHQQNQTTINEPLESLFDEFRNPYKDVINN